MMQALGFLLMVGSVAGILGAMSFRSFKEGNKDGGIICAGVAVFYIGAMMAGYEIMLK